MAKKADYWRCEFGCRFHRVRKEQVMKHEAHCFKNPNRTPYLGELTSIRSTGRIVNYGTDHGIDHIYMEGFPWMEWEDWDEMPAWWPGEGKIWNGQLWQDVVGYESRPITGAHGCAGGAGCEDVWPTIDGIPLNKIQPRALLDAPNAR